MNIIKKLNERIKLNITQKIMILEILAWIGINIIFWDVLYIMNTQLASYIFSIIWLPDLILLFLALILMAGKTGVHK